MAHELEMLRKLRHRIAHLFSWNTGRVVSFWLGDDWMIGFQCDHCGEVDGARKVSSRKQESSSEREVCRRGDDPSDTDAGNLPFSEMLSKLTECNWSFDETAFDGQWQSGCGNIFEFNDDGPVENGCKFCMYCGGLVRVKE